VHALQVFARDVDGGQVDFAQRDGLDRRVLQFFGGPAVAATDDQRACRLRMRDRRNVDEVFMIEKLVLLDVMNGRRDGTVFRTALSREPRSPGAAT
jgi:hypothetical protein